MPLATESSADLETMPAPAGASAPDAPSASLPTLLTRFIGRERELEEVAALLQSSRLLTLTGAGGSGKTRLAAEAAARHDSHDLLAWVDLATLADPELLDRHLTQALRIGERPGSTHLDLLRGFIGSQRVLLVLDNCEHLIDACAQLVEALLLACPQLRILATSRQALGVAGETAWLAPPMASPEAVQLFVDRARAVQPGFALTAENARCIGETCGRLDGIPLAIELAAARVRVLTPEQISARLSDAMRLLSGGSRTALPRHRTLRGTLEWSYALLNEWEQVLLQRLAVFAGSFTLDAAERVCAGGAIDAEDVLDGVSMLVDKSLIVLDSCQNEARYRMLETVRQFSLERLAACEELDMLRARHAAYYLALAESSAPRLFGGASDLELMRQLTLETPNMRAVADWAAADRSRNEVLLRLGWSLHWFWFARGQFEEMRVLLSTALASDAPKHPLHRARALVALGHVLIWQVKLELPHQLENGGRARQVMQEALEVARTLGDDEVTCSAMIGVGAGLFFEGNLEAAAPQLEAATECTRTMPVHVLGALARYWRGWVAKERGDLELAHRSLVEASEIGRALQSAPAIAHPLSLLGQVQVAQGRCDDARRSFGEGLRIHARIGDTWGVARGLEGMAVVSAAVGDVERAGKLFGAAEAMRERIGAPVAPMERLWQQQYVERARAAAPSVFDAAWTIGRTVSMEDAVSLAVLAASSEEPAPLAATKPAIASDPGAAPSAPALEPAPYADPPSPPAGAVLVVRTLGKLQVIRDGGTVDGTAWGSSRVRELLVFLLAHPAGCTKEQVGVALWPEASSEQVRNSFHVTLHRLRKALGHGEWIAAQNERYQLEPSLVIDFDAARFERDTAAALSALGDGRTGASAALAAALAAYEGDFLESESPGGWHLQIRERLQRLYIEGQLALGAHFAAINDYAGAIEALQRAIARNTLHEAAWRLLMTVQTRAGERAQAMRTYQRLAALLEAELDAGPDEATTRLFERIGAGAEV